MKRISAVLLILAIGVAMNAMAAEHQPDTEIRIPVKPAITQQTEIDPLIAELKEAKRVGDEERVLILEAQLWPSTKTSGGEAGSGAELRPSTTISGVGDPNKGGTQYGSPEWWFDIQVSPDNSADREWHPDIATASNGDMYVVFEDVFGGDRYIQVYWSQDGGSTWNALGFVSAPGSDLTQPTIAVGEGSSRNNVLIAYIVDDGTNERTVEVATSPLTSGPFTTHAVAGQPSLWDYYKPVIWTDSHSYSSWWAYLIAEASFDGSATNRNVTFWRSTDGTSYPTENHLWGSLDTEEWIDPDGTFGTSGRDVFVTVYNDTTDTLYSRRSTDLGSTFETPVAVYAFPADQVPSRDVDPDIEAAIDGNNVMVACTKAFAGNDNPAYSYSTDNGATWTTLYSMNGHTTLDEFAVVLNANEGGESFHVAWTDTDFYIHANSRPQDLSALFSSSPPVVNDTDFASVSYPVKGITSNWTSDMERVVWSDFRQGGGQYSIFYDEDFFIIIIIPIFIDGFESGNTDAWSASTMP